VSAAVFRSGFVAVLGRPNVGKSTLVNRLVGHKVSIVSDHPQTTRRRISGVVTGDDFQLVLLDLPGFQRPFDSLTRRMQATVDATLTEVDAALFMLNAAEAPGGGDRYIAKAVATAGTPYVAVLNKVDAVTRDVLAARRAAAEELLGGGEVRPISALRGDGLAEVVAALVAAMPEGPVYFPEGEVSDQPLELLVSELIREQALRVTREEVPHAVAVQIESITERPGDSLVEIDAHLIVEHESQKAILIGKGGSVVKRIGSGARGEIETVLGARVFLALRVKVRKHWRRDDRYVDHLL
jgi:GTP-binding protein Era